MSGTIIQTAEHHQSEALFVDFGSDLNPAAVSLGDLRSKVEAETDALLGRVIFCPL